MFGPVTVNGLSGSPSTFTLTLIVIVAFVWFVMFVTIQVRFCVVLSKLTTVSPVTFTTSMNSSPSGKLSTNVKVSFQSSSPTFSTVR